MELIYLWVEKYKNIKNQGFNFSSKFRFEFDDKGLNIIDKKSIEEFYPEDFFANNINITAIVGENGSGKSNTIEALLSNLIYSSIPVDEPYKVVTVYYNSIDDKFYYKNLNARLQINKPYLYRDIDALRKYSISQPKKTGNFTLHYNYGLDWIYNNENNLNFNKYFHKNDNYKTPLLLQPNKKDNKIHISNIDYLANRDILNFTIHRDISFDFIEDFFTPTKFKLSYELTNISKREDNHIYTSILSYYENPQKSLKEKLIYLTRVYIVLKTYSKGEDNDYILLKDSDFKTTFTREGLNEKNLDVYVNNISKNSFEDLYSDEFVYMIAKIKQSFLFLEYLNNQDDIDHFIFSSSNILTIEENKDLLLNLAPWIEIEFFNENNISFYSLSYGQKFLVKFIYSLLNQLLNLTSHKEYKNIILILDEVEQGLHPNWQKKYLSILINILNTDIEGFDYKYNIICATHSPFILSDLPKENIIFLKEGQEVKPFKEKEQTFGANIHTLLAHGFFMEDGLIGSFAKTKIDDIKKLYDKYKNIKENDVYFQVAKKEFEDKQELFLYINSIIGEKYLQTVIKNYLYELEQIFNTKDYRVKKRDKLLEQFSKKEIQEYLDNTI